MRRRIDRLIAPYRGLGEKERPAPQVELEIVTPEPELEERLLPGEVLRRWVRRLEILRRQRRGPLPAERVH